VDWVLVRNHCDLATVERGGGVADCGGNSRPTIEYRLHRFWKVERSLEVCGQLTGKDVVELLPTNPRPSSAAAPLQESVVEGDFEIVHRRDSRCGLFRSEQWGREHHLYFTVRQVDSGRLGLRHATLTQPVPRKVGVHDVVGVFDLAVTDEVYQRGAHGLECRRGYRGGMDAFATRFMHVDMDAFYVEVERLDDPTLIGVPVVVGGLGTRGVVASASYEARQHGVGSAMPIIEARRRLPRARYVPPDMTKYGAMSKRVFAVLEEFSPFVEPLSIDEAFLDVSGLRLHFDSPRQVGEELRMRIRRDTGLPASVGVAAVKFLAKMASKAAKPDGIYVIEAGTEADFLAPLDVAELWGVGQATLASLAGLGVATIGELAAVEEPLLRRHLGVANAAHLTALANGRDPRTVDTGRESKSISVETTYSTDIFEQDEIGRALLSLCHKLSARLLHASVGGRTISLKLRFGDFTTVSRSVTVDGLVSDTSQIWPHASDLLARVEVDGRGVRLLGIGVTGLSEGEPSQLALDGSDRVALAEAAAEVRERFGDDAVLPARLAPSPADDTDG